MAAGPCAIDRVKEFDDGRFTGGVRVLRRSRPRLGAARHDARLSTSCAAPACGAASTARCSPRSRACRPPRSPPAACRRATACTAIAWASSRTAGSSCATSARPISAATCAAPPAARCWCPRSPSASPRRAASSPSRTSRRAPPTSSIPSISATSIIARAPSRPAARASAPWTVTHDSAGDWAMTQRFCAEVLSDAKPAVAFLWICDPDHTLHGVPLGSPAHADVLRQADRCVAEVHRTVERLRARGRGDPAAGRLRPRP